MYKNTRAAFTILLLFAGSFITARHVNSIVFISAEGTGPEYKIEWYGEISSFDDFRETDFVEDVIDFIVGESGAGKLVRPAACALADTSALYVLDQGTYRIVKFDFVEREITVPESEAEHIFPSLADACMLPNGDLLFTDSKLNKIFICRSGEEEITEFKLSETLLQPTGIAYNRITDEIWITETGRHRLTVCGTAGSVTGHFGERGSGRMQFNFPAHICTDDSGRVYVSDAMNFRIVVLNSEGKFINSFGKLGDVTGTFSRPKGVAVDSHGHIYVVDALFHNVQVFNIKGELLTYFGGQGREHGKFWLPGGICVDKNDHIYIADSYNSRVQIFTIEEKR